MQGTVDDRRGHVLQRLLSNATFMTAPAMAYRISVLPQVCFFTVTALVEKDVGHYQQGLYRLPC